MAGLNCPGTEIGLKSIVYFHKNPSQVKIHGSNTGFKIIFPQDTDEEKRPFILLIKSYIDSRYKMGYTIAPEDLQWLIDRVNVLRLFTEEICLERISKLI